MRLDDQQCVLQDKPSPKAGSKEENEDVFTWKAKVSSFPLVIYVFKKNSYVTRSHERGLKSVL